MESRCLDQSTQNRDACGSSSHFKAQKTLTFQGVLDGRVREVRQSLLQAEASIARYACMGSLCEDYRLVAGGDRSS